MNELAKLKWRCRRGMRELDVLLERYLNHCYIDAPVAEQCTFRNLLDMEDADLYAYFIGYQQPVDKEVMVLLEKIRQFVASTD